MKFQDQTLNFLDCGRYEGKVVRRGCLKIRLTCEMFTKFLSAYLLRIVRPPDFLEVLVQNAAAALQFE